MVFAVARPVTWCESRREFVPSSSRQGGNWLLCAVPLGADVAERPIRIEFVLIAQNGPDQQVPAIQAAIQANGQMKARGQAHYVRRVIGDFEWAFLTTSRLSHFGGDNEKRFPLRTYRLLLKYLVACALRRELDLRAPAVLSDCDVHNLRDDLCFTGDRRQRLFDTAHESLDVSDVVLVFQFFAHPQRQASPADAEIMQVCCSCSIFLSLHELIHSISRWQALDSLFGADAVPRAAFALASAWDLRDALAALSAESNASVTAERRRYYLQALRQNLSSLSVESFEAHRPLCAVLLTATATQVNSFQFLTGDRPNWRELDAASASWADAVIASVPAAVQQNSLLVAMLRLVAPRISPGEVWVLAWRAFGSAFQFGP